MGLLAMSLQSGGGQVTGLLAVCRSYYSVGCVFPLGPMMRKGKARMPLTFEEVVPGAVAFFQPDALLSNAEVTHDDQLAFRPGPFVCVASDGQHCTWLILTTTRDHRGKRLQLKASWLLDGSDVWRGRPQYISDARKPYSGPVSAFIAASNKELPYKPHKRPNVSAEGVAAIVDEMKRYGVNLL